MIFLSDVKASLSDCVLCLSRTFAKTRWVCKSSNEDVDEILIWASKAESCEGDVEEKGTDIDADENDEEYGVELFGTKEDADAHPGADGC